MKNPLFLKPLRLLPRVQHYHWGLKKSNSLVGMLSSDVDKDAPYAELWVGAHPDLPSDVVAAVPFNLNQIISTFPQDMLGETVVKNFGATLPFLFKVLSVGKPLSIQAHPDKKLASLLYREKGYPDENHKPEMAIAINKVEILCGFRHLPDIAVDFSRIPELKSCIGDELLDVLIKRTTCSEEQILQEVCRRILTVSSEQVTLRCRSLRERLLSQDKLCHRDAWVLRLLTEEFQNGDVGVFFFYLMNLLTLQPGNTIFIPPNTAHAYLSGELAECMANSDNVVRGGLTPKTKDIDTLLSMLTYKASCPEVMRPSLDMNLITYPTPAGFNEFSANFLQKESEIVIPAGHPSIFLSIDGAGVVNAGDSVCSYDSGDAFFIPAAVPFCKIKSNTGRAFLITVPCT